MFSCLFHGHCLAAGLHSTIFDNKIDVLLFQPQVGIFPWGPVLDGNFTVPGDQWSEGWQEKDWHFLWETPEELIRRGKFNHGLSYMSGVTTQEAAFFICECNF
jgi:hypothetical protein